MISDARIKQGLQFIAEDFRYVVEICEAATAKRNKKQSKKKQEPVIINYCNDCGRLKEWPLTFSMKNRQVCNFCGERKPCLTCELPDESALAAAWKLDNH